MLAFWSRLSLRVQAAVAVAAPCLAVALFASIYFPNRLNEQAGLALENQARSLGLLAASNAAPIMRLIGQDLAQPSELSAILEGIRAGGNVATVGALAVLADSVQEQGGRRFLMVKAGDTQVQMLGDLPPGRYELPAGNEQCTATRGTFLEVGCVAQEKDFKALLIIRYSLSALATTQRENQVVGLWVLLAALVVGLSLAIFFSGAIAGPLSLVSRVARQVAGGDVTVAQVAVSGAHEVQSMAASVNDMVVSLRGLVSEMIGLTARLKSASGDLSSASADQQEVTNQQSAYSQEVAATFEELMRTAEMISRSTDVVGEAAQRTNAAVAEARLVVSEIVTNMMEIRQEATEIASAITQLNSDVQQVSRIAQLIKQVADRSDLLALNAALEGTKAGEVGRGFSVVAAEMRKLAESVAQSARDIGRIVESVHASGDLAVSRARQGVDSSARGARTAEKASAAFAQIVELSRGTKEAAEQISVATKQQRESSEQAVSGARNVADLMQKGMDATGRANRIAQDLQQSVDALTGFTQKFRVEKQE